MSKQTLQWGETPWDNLSRDDLLYTVKRMYSALNSARSVMAVLAVSGPQTAYWTVGTGGRALSKADQALAGISDEDCYRAFFRYADDLLFDGVGAGWVVCEKDGQMFGSDAGAEGARAECFCGAPTRRLRWSDLEKKT